MPRRVLLFLAFSLPTLGFIAPGCGSTPSNVAPPEQTQAEIDAENKRAAEELAKQPRS